MPFLRPTLAELIARTESDLAARLGLGRLSPRGVLTVLARAHAGLMHGLYGYVSWAALQVLPDTADVEALERWANDLGVPRKPATFAEGAVIFSGSNGVDIDIGTLVQRADGERYETTEDGTIAGGALTLRVVAQRAGAAANAGPGMPVSLISPIAGVQSQAEVDSSGIAGGVDDESDDDLRARVLQRMASQPHGGSAADYVRWCLEVPGVTRAWCLPEHFGIGTVGVTFAVDGAPGGPIPDSTMVAEVQAYIDDPERRPVPAQVTVFAPGALVVDFEIDAIDPDTAAVRNAVEIALAELIRREGAPGQPLLLSHVREAISNAPGERDHVLVTPAANVAVSAGEIPVMGAVTWT